MLVIIGYVLVLLNTDLSFVENTVGPDRPHGF